MGVWDTNFCGCRINARWAFLSGRGETGALVMWVLVWIHLLYGKLEYYQLGNFATEDACYDQKAKAKVLQKDQNSGLFCLFVEVQ